MNTLSPRERPIIQKHTANVNSTLAHNKLSPENVRYVLTGPKEDRIADTIVCVQEPDNKMPNPGKFKGMRKAFLTQQLPLFAEAVRNVC